MALLHVKVSDLVQFVMRTLVSRDFVPFCKYIKRQMYLGNQAKHAKLYKILSFFGFPPHFEINVFP